MTVRAPTPEDRAYAHDVYFRELVEGVFRPDTRIGLLRVVDRLRQAGAEAVILGGTELPLLLGEDSGASIPLLDTARLHAAALLEAAYPT